MSEVSNFGVDNFDAEVLAADKPVLVDFWAAWCGPCKMMGPVVDEIARDFTGRLKVGKVNIDENRSLATQFGIMSIPTLILFKGGAEVKRIIGYQGKTELTDAINQVI